MKGRPNSGSRSTDSSTRHIPSAARDRGVTGEKGGSADGGPAAGGVEQSEKAGTTKKGNGGL